jgi:hypothetical protein
MVRRVLQGMLLEKQRTVPEATQAIVDDADLVKSLLLVAVELVCLWPCACMAACLRMASREQRTACKHLQVDQSTLRACLDAVALAGGLRMAGGRHAVSSQDTAAGLHAPGLRHAGSHRIFSRPSDTCKRCTAPKGATADLASSMLRPSHLHGSSSALLPHDVHVLQDLPHHPLRCQWQPWSTWASCG